MKVFSKYDVPETSYHFYSERIDLHFCDDPGRKYLRDGASVLPSRLMFKDYSCACNYKNILFYHSDALSDLSFHQFPVLSIDMLWLLFGILEISLL